MMLCVYGLDPSFVKGKNTFVSDYLSENSIGV